MNTHQQVNKEETIQLSLIQDDPGWVTAEHRVEEFRALLRRGERFSGLLLRRVEREDHTVTFEIIDGFARYRALVAEKVAAYPAVIEICDDRGADRRRLGASVEQDGYILYARLAHVVRCRFRGDQLLQLIQNAGLYERRMDEHLKVEVIERTGQVPQSPLIALLTIKEHMKAKALRDARAQPPSTTSARPGRRSAPAAPEEELYPFVPTELWERQLWAWFEEIGTWLKGGSTIVHLLDLVLEILLRGRLDYEYVLDDLFTVPDREMTELLIERYEWEGYPEGGRGRRASPFPMLLEYLGLSRHPSQPEWFNLPIQRTRSEIIAMLQQHSLHELRQQALERRQKELEESSEEDLRHFWGSLYSRTARMRRTRKAQVTPDPYAEAHVVSQDLLNQWKVFAEGGGDWNRADIQRDLQKVIAAAQKRLTPTDNQDKTRRKRQSGPDL